MGTREQILDAAARLFAEAGVNGATTRRIAEVAGVNEVSLFRHFGTKDQLIREAVSSAVSHEGRYRLPELPIHPQSELTAWCREQLGSLFASRAFLRSSMAAFSIRPDVAADGCAAPAVIAEELRSYLGRLRRHGWIDRKVDLRSATELLMGTLVADALSRDIFPERYPQPLAKAGASYARLFVRAIGLAPRS